MRTTTGFLSGRDAFELDLPDEIDPRPLMQSVIIFDGGPRTVIYEPAQWRPDPNGDPSFVRRFDMRTPPSVATVYRTREEPSYVAAFWRVADGWVNTFVDDQTGCGADLEGAMKVLLSHVSVRERRFGRAQTASPTLDLTAPVEPGDPRDAVQRDMIKFLPRQGDATEVTLRRMPDWAREGRTTRSFSALVEASVATAAQVEVTVSGPPDAVERLRGQADAVAASLVPSG
jgi:hypothetical protein